MQPLTLLFPTKLNHHGVVPSELELALKKYNWEEVLRCIAESDSPEETVNLIPNRIFFYVLDHAIWSGGAYAETALDHCLKSESKMRGINREQIDSLGIPKQIYPPSNWQADDTTVATRLIKFFNTPYAEQVSLETLKVIQNHLSKKRIDSERLQELINQKQEALNQQHTRFSGRRFESL